MTINLIPKGNINKAEQKINYKEYATDKKEF